MTGSASSTSSPPWSVEDVLRCLVLYRCAGETRAGEQCRISVGREKESNAKTIIANFSTLREDRLRRLAYNTLCLAHQDQEEEAATNWRRILQSEAFAMARSLSVDCKLVWRFGKSNRSQVVQRNEADNSVVRGSGQSDERQYSSMDASFREMKTMMRQTREHLNEFARRQWEKERLDHEKACRQWEEERLAYDKRREEWTKESLEREQIRSRWEKESLARQKASREWEEECFSNEERRQQWDEEYLGREKTRKLWEQECRVNDRLCLEWREKRSQWDVERASRAQECRQLEEEYHHHVEECQQWEANWAKFVQVWDVLGALSLPSNGRATSMLSSWPNKVSMRLLRSESSGEGFLDNLATSSFLDKQNFGTTVRRSLLGHDRDALWASARFANGVRAAFSTAMGLKSGREQLEA